MKRNVLKIKICLAFVLLIGAVFYNGKVFASAAESSADASSERMDMLIAELSEVTDSLGTSYYYYNQLTDEEKVIYWKLQEATWDSPSVIIKGVENYTATELDSMQYRAMAALMADKPMLTLYWKDYNTVELSEDGTIFTITLNKHYINSEYMIEKSKARIEQIVAMVGSDGDRYTRVRELLEWLGNETEYNPYHPFNTNIIVDVYDASPIGLLTKNIAVCDGYADTIKILCDELEIPCIIVGNAGHAWNMIQMEDGNWYLVDGTAATKYQLIGKTSTEYIDNNNYFISDMCLRKEGDFLFPELSENAYEYSGEYTPEYFDVESSFTEPESIFVYEVNDDGNTCTIVGYEGIEEGDLVIPSEIDSYTVTVIGSSAFFACKGFVGDLIIPDTVTVIEDGAFLYCDGLKGSLKLSENLAEIQSHAFVGCSNLSGTLELPESLKKIDRTAFFRCKSFIGDLILPSEIEEIGVEAFSECSGLDGVFYLPDGLEWASGMISGTKLSEIQVSDTNTMYKISDGVLYSSDMKTLLACAPGRTGSLKVPEGVEKIEELACYQCAGLDGKLVLPSTLKTIGRFAFYETEFIGNLRIPDSVTAIGESAFSGAGFTGSLILSENLKVIESATFWNCGFVGDVIIPDSVTIIDESAFFAVNFGGALQMSKNIQYIGNYALYGDYISSLDFTNSDVVLEKNALFGTWFTDYICNCEAEKILTQAPATDTENGYIWSVCSHCGGGDRTVIKYINGLDKASDGKWYYYTNGLIDTSFEGLAENAYGWWYIKQGTIDMTYTGLVKYDYAWWYVKNGKLDKRYVGLVKYKSNWVYVNKGKLDSTYTGLVKYKSKWVYVNKGKLDATYTGLVKYKSKWVYVVKGNLNATYTGLVKYKTKWVYVVKGNLNATYTGLVKYKSKWVYVNKGNLDTTYTGMAKNQYGWFYVTNGKLDLTFTGIAKNDYGTWYLKNGKLDLTFSGKVTVGDKLYTIKNGKVIK